MARRAPAEGVTELDPAIVHFTFSRIRPVFSCGRTIASTLDQFIRRELTPSDLPLLSVLTDGAGNYYSQNNRRLFLYKELRQCGVLETVPVRLRQLPDTRRMREKYTPEKCSMRAILKREGQSQQPSSSLPPSVHFACGCRENVVTTEEEEEEVQLDKKKKKRRG